MFLPPPGVRMRRTIETQWLTDQPTVIAERDPQRVLLIVMVDFTNGAAVTFAGSEAGLSTSVPVGAGYAIEFHFCGPEEVWAKWVTASGITGVNILIQSVFYD